MKNLLAIQGKYKVALALLTMIVLLLCGVLLERNFLGELNKASASIYNDRLIPSTAVYHISDHITQRRFLVQECLEDPHRLSKNEREELTLHRLKEDSIVKAFEQTFLVADESERLNRLKIHLRDFYLVEESLLDSTSQYTLADLNSVFFNIRHELRELSKIQTRVGQKLLDKSESLSSKAGMVSQFQVVILVIICLVAQGFILASKAIIPAFKQKHNLN